MDVLGIYRRRFDLFAIVRLAWQSWWTCGTLEAAARIVVYICKTHHRVVARCFDALQKLLEAHPEVTLARFKATVREQWAILAIDEHAAIDALRGQARAIDIWFASEHVDSDGKRGTAWVTT